MKTSPSTFSRRRPQAAAGAFTLAEMIIAMAIFSLVVLAVVSLQIFGLQMNSLAAGKMRSTASSLKILNRVRDQVLEADNVVVGNGSASSFTSTGTSGDALQVYPGTSTNTYVRFFLSTNTLSFYEQYSTNNEATLIATNIINQTAFQTVDFQGNISSSSQEHYSIRMTLQFAQLEFTIPVKGYDYYTLETEMTPRYQ